MEIEDWGISDSLKQELDSHYKTKYSLSLVDQEPIDIARALTFDGLAHSVTARDLSKFLETLNSDFLKNGIRGVGLEIGSGPGTFVATLANFPQVTKVYGVEACEAIIKTLMTKVVTSIAGENQHKVVGAIADFDALHLEDNSVDFVFDFFSLHHSVTPLITLSELYRVLKPGGVIFCVDKARANSMSEMDLEALLEIEYSEKTKISMGIPPEKKHTRRMNGENEYRLRDWDVFFREARFVDFEHYNIAKIGGSRFIKCIKYMIVALPKNAQVRCSHFFSKRVTNNLEPSQRIFSNIFPAYPREFSLMIAWKK